MHEVKKIQELLNQIDHNEILLPEFQRGYVWKPDQVRGLMQSLYRKHPTGHLLIWNTYKPSLARGAAAARNGRSLLLLDGQQRLTTLYVLFKGKHPRFYEGESLFFDLWFNMQTEEFRFYQKLLMAKNPYWISVHEFLNETFNGLLERLSQLDDDRQQVIQANLARLSRLDEIRNYSYTVDQVSGDEFELDEVVNIFNRVNSAGTPLTKADLALAHICSIWPEARAEMRDFKETMAGEGFDVEFDFLIRCLAGAATGSVRLEGSFFKISASDLQTAWEKMRPAFRHLVGVLRHDAFIDALDNLPTHNVLVPVTVYLIRQGGRFPTEAIKKRFIRWLYLAGIWARYSGASETKLQQDVALTTQCDTDPTHELEEAILRERGRVILEAEDLKKAMINSAVGRFSCVLARARDARDWFTGGLLYEHGKSNGLERHYIFSRDVLLQVESGKDTDRRLINELANRVVLTQKADKKIASSPPNEYLPAVEENQPGALLAQSIPMNRDLWEPKLYLDFLAERRRLLAKAMNDYIASWEPQDEMPFTESTARRLMAAGESGEVEFKSSLRWDLRENRVNKELEKVIVKTLAGFLNSEGGGTLLIGVNDEGKAVGLAPDYESLKKKDRDGFERHLRQLIESSIGASASSFLTVTFHEIDARDICHVSADRSDHPIYIFRNNQSVFYLRTGPATKELPLVEAVKYIDRHFGRRF